MPVQLGVLRRFQIIDRSHSTMFPIHAAMYGHNSLHPLSTAQCSPSPTNVPIPSFPTYNLAPTPPCTGHNSLHPSSTLTPRPHHHQSTLEAIPTRLSHSSIVLQVFRVLLLCKSPEHSGWHPLWLSLHLMRLQVQCEGIDQLGRSIP